MFTLVTHKRYRCHSCGCQYRPNSRWDWTGYIIGVALSVVVFLLYRWHILPALLAIALLLFILGLGLWLFPFITPMEAAAPKIQKHEDVAS
jgi:hypothetical protein